MHIPLFGFSKDFSDCFRLLALHPELFSCVVISCLATAAKSSPVSCPAVSPEKWNGPEETYALSQAVHTLLFLHGVSLQFQAGRFKLH